LTKTFDNKRKVKPLRLIDVDEAFFNWWDKKLNLQLMNSKGERVKVPCLPVSSERWSLARESGIRNEEGVLVVPIVAIARTGEGGPNEPGYQRIFADIKQDHTYYKEVSDKTSLIKELNNARIKEVDPSLPIYEIYTHQAPDHYVLTYEVSVWVAYVDQMNEIIEKVGQDLDYKSVKSFQFETADGFYFQAFQEGGLEDEGNLNEFSGKERIVKKMFTFKVPAYLMPQSDQRRDTFRRYWSQTKLVFKEETSITREALAKLTGKR
jgi:hypothetical protein